MEKEQQEKQIRLHILDQLMQANNTRRNFNEEPHSLDKILQDCKRITDFILTGEVDAKPR